MEINVVNVMVSIVVACLAGCVAGVQFAALFGGCPEAEPEPVRYDEEQR